MWIWPLRGVRVRVWVRVSVRESVCVYYMCVCLGTQNWKRRLRDLCAMNITGEKPSAAMGTYTLQLQQPCSRSSSSVG